MKTTRNLRIVAAAVFAVIVVGCATPEARIQAHPDVFAKLTTGEQALVKQGKVAPGFDMDSVRLALGDPDRIVIETNASGRHEIWRYVTYGDDRAALYIDGSFTPHDVVGGPNFTMLSGYNNLYPGKDWGSLYVRPNSALYFYSTYPGRPYELIRVEFDTAGRVAMVRQRNL